MEGLDTDFERWRAGAHWIGLIFACGGADEIHGNGWRNVGAAIIEGVGVDVDGVAVVVAPAVGGGGDDDAGVDDVGGVGAVAEAVVWGGIDTAVVVVVVVVETRDRRGRE